jgi:hypothetical protein
MTRITFNLKKLLTFEGREKNFVTHCMLGTAREGSDMHNSIRGTVNPP